MIINMHVSLCNCFKDRLAERHSCLYLYPCVIKVQSISQSVNPSDCLHLCSQELMVATIRSAGGYNPVTICLFQHFCLPESMTVCPSLFDWLDVRISLLPVCQSAARSACLRVCLPEWMSVCPLLVGRQDAGILLLSVAQLVYMFVSQSG